jgi:hypothetical protein
MYGAAININPFCVLPICAYRMSLQSAIIGFLVSKILAKPITPQENVVVQTTAVATGTVCRLPKADDMKSSDFFPLDAAGSGVCRNYPCTELARRAERRISSCHLDLDLCSWLVLCYRLFWVSLCLLILTHRNIELTIVQRLHVPSYQKESGTWDLKTLYWWAISKSTDRRRETRVPIWNCDCSSNIGTSWDTFNKFRITTTTWI